MCSKSNLKQRVWPLERPLLKPNTPRVLFAFVLDRRNLYLPFLFAMCYSSFDATIAPKASPSSLAVSAFHVSDKTKALCFQPFRASEARNIYLYIYIRIYVFIIPAPRSVESPVRPWRFCDQDQSQSAKRHLLVCIPRFLIANDIVFTPARLPKRQKLWSSSMCWCNDRPWTAKSI